MLLLALGLARGLHMAGSYLLFGTLLLPAILSAAGPRAGFRLLAGAALLLALAAGAAWFLLQSADMASATSLGQVWAALPVVARFTRFGWVLPLRLALLIAGFLCFRAGFARLALLPAGAAILAEAWLGHGAAMSGGIGALLFAAELLHLAGGAAWVGSLPGLGLMITASPAPEAARLARLYSPFGIACVLAILASAAVQFLLLIGPPRNLFTTLYGNVALAKILCLAGLILLAALNRYRFTPALAAGAKRQILRSLGGEIALGFAAILAAGWLLNLAPPTMAAMLAGQQ